MKGFRLLALVAEPPELSPGATVVLRPLVVGDERPRYEWGWCAVTSGPASAHACLLEPSAPFPSPILGTGPNASVPWPDDSMALAALCDSARRTEAPVDALRLDCDAERPEVFVRLEVSSSSGERIVAVRPVPLRRAGAAANLNPVVNEVWINSGDERRIFDSRTVLSSGIGIEMELGISSSEAELYEDEAGQAQQEVLRATWFVAGGSTTFERTAFIPDDATATFGAFVRNEWRLPETGERASLYLVVRDDRGGAAWVERHAALAGDDS